MKKIFQTIIALGLVASSTSCKKYLDVNTNPNDVTTATADLVLPQALAASAALSNTFNGSTYGMDLGGYIANGGGVSGFGNFWTFVFNSGDATACWSNTYDNLQDYQYILNNTTATGDYKYFNAVARLMKAIDFMRLVDAYGDVPYTQALQGSANLLPAYDKGPDVYKACIAEIDAAITQFKSASTATTVNIGSSPNGKIDVTVYSTLGANTTNQALSNGGLDMTNWIKFANTVKLRALLRISKVTSLASTFAAGKTSMAAFTAADFISADVLINPGYLQQSGKQNPLWNSLAWDYTGKTATASFVPSTFVTGFYSGAKLTDDGRGKIIYRDYNHSNQLGLQGGSVPSNPTGGEWYTGPTSGGISSYGGLGIMKGYDMGQPILMASECYFIQAEANLIGLITTGTPESMFNSGVLASFNYLDKDHNDILSASRNPTTEVAAYKTANAGSYLVNYNLATTDAQRLEAIITQKYIALNTLNSDEGWNDYRRTQYPISNPNGTATTSFAPNFATNASPRADKLAGRILYPSSEYSYNTANVPSVNVNTTLVFWDSRP